MDLMSTVKLALSKLGNNVFNSPVGDALVKYQNSSVGKATQGLGDIFVNKPVQFGYQMGMDMEQIANTVNALREAKMAPTLSYNPEGAKNLLEQGKRAGTFGLGLAGASAPLNIAAISGGTGVIDAALAKYRGSSGSDAINTGMNKMIESIPQSTLAAGVGVALNPTTARTIQAKGIKAFGGDLRSSKGSYATMDNFVNNTRAYFKRAR